MNKRRVLINACMSTTQVLVTGVCLFILYRFLLTTLGIERLGIWSLVLATTSLANMANLGLSASNLKFVAQYLARGDEQTVCDVIQTTVLSVGVLIGAILLLAYPFAGWLLVFVVPAAYLHDALAILPYALVSLWAMLIMSVYQAGLDGYQRMDLSGILVMSGTILNVLLCFILAPAYGLLGLAYARIIQSLFLLAASWLLLKRQLRSLPLIPVRWNKIIFKEMVGYGLNFQIITISQTLYDPMTKALLTKFGGPGMTGFYEMASRMILQLRALLVSANRVLVPATAEMQEKNPNQLNKLYDDSYRLILYISLPFFSILIAGAPIASLIWIGYYEHTFVLFSTLLAVGYFFNTLINPAYFSNLGTGRLGWNTAAHLIIAVLNMGLGMLWGSLYGGSAVVVAWIVALCTGNLIILISFHTEHTVPLSKIFPKEYLSIGIGSMTALFLSLALFRVLHTRVGILSVSLTMLMAFAAVIMLPVWLHPIRKQLVGLFLAEVLKKRGAL